jgi:hypothetical protein
MQNQRIRNLSTGILHTKIQDIYEDIDYLVGSDGVMTHMLPNAAKAIKPYIEKFASDQRFWNSEFDQSHYGETEIPQMNDDEKAAFWQRYEALPSIFGAK